MIIYNNVDYMKSSVNTTPEDGSPKVEGAFAAMKRDILSGRLAPNAPLRLMALSTLYGVGYTPLREALSRLESAGLAVLSPNRGYRVAPVSLEELEDLEQARTVVETALLEAAIAHGDLAWEAGIVAAHHRLSRAARGLQESSAGVPDWMEAHDAFHQALVAAAQSAWLKSFQRQVSEQLRRHHQALLFHPDLGKPARQGGHDRETRKLLSRALALEHHTQLMEAALARDTARALHLMRAHVQFTLAVYRSVAGAPDGRAKKGIP